MGEERLVGRSAARAAVGVAEAELTCPLEKNRTVSS
jgi:hypothetical protein